MVIWHWKSDNIGIPRARIKRAQSGSSISRLEIKSALIWRKSGANLAQIWRVSRTSHHDAPNFTLKGIGRVARWHRRHRQHMGNCPNSTPKRIGRPPQCSIQSAPDFIWRGIGRTHRAGPPWIAPLLFYYDNKGHVRPISQIWRTDQFVARRTLLKIH